MKIIENIYKISTYIFPHEFIISVVVLGQKIYNLFKYGDLNFPRGFSIEITTHCNRRCFYCPQSVSPTKPREIKMDIYLKWLERLKELKWNGVVTFHFYNEPLLCDNLEKYVAIAKEKLPNCMFNITSNGDFLTEERLLSLLESGVFKFTLTQHIPYSKEWDKRIGALKKKYPTRISYHSLEGWTLSNRGGKVTKNISKNKYGITEESQKLRKKGCFMQAGHNTTIDGDYLWCCCDYDKVNLMNNVFKSSIMESWNSEPWRTLRKKVQNKTPVLDVCKSCFGYK